MGVQFLIQPVRRLGQQSDGVFVTSGFDPDLLAESGVEWGTRTVVLLSEWTWDGRGALTFPPEKARLLKRGASREAVFLTEQARGHKKHPTDLPSREGEEGDQIFIQALERTRQPTLLEIGQGLLSGLRIDFRGRFVYKERSQTFVHYPDNFVAFRVQPRDRSVRVDVYGTPSQFPIDQERKKSLRFTHGRPSYSWFKVKSAEQVPLALEIIRKAHELKHG